MWSEEMMRRDNGKNNTARSQLGLDRSKQIHDNTMNDLLEHENDQQLNHLSKNISELKDIANEIQIHVNDSLRYTNELDRGMGGAGNMLSNSFAKLKLLAASGGSSMHMCYLVAFVVVIFLLVYFMVVWLAKNKT